MIHFFTVKAINRVTKQVCTFSRLATGDGPEECQKFHEELLDNYYIALTIWNVVE